MLETAKHIETPRDRINRENALIEKQLARPLTVRDEVWYLKTIHKHEKVIESIQELAAYHQDLHKKVSEFNGQWSHEVKVEVEGLDALIGGLFMEVKRRTDLIAKYRERIDGNQRNS